MGKQTKLKATLSENVNKVFRLQTKLIHIIIKNNDVKKFPIIINNFNRLEWLQQQVDWLLSVGQKNIHIIDNASSYEPLLKYYEKTPATVYLLDNNMGHEAFWKTHLHQRFGKYYHVYTDPDVLPDDNTPTDFMYYFKDILDRYPAIQKVGFGLRYNNLPDYYMQKEEVIKWESQFYKNAVEPNIYKASIDTTFALYKPGTVYQCWNDTLRTGGQYMLRHMPWNEDSNNLSTESLYYLQKASAASSWIQNSKVDTKIYHK